MTSRHPYVGTRNSTRGRKPHRRGPKIAAKATASALSAVAGLGVLLPGAPATAQSVTYPAIGVLERDFDPAEQHGSGQRARTGWNSMETVLTPTNVNTSTFGKLFTTPVDERIYGQVLYAVCRLAADDGGEPAAVQLDLCRNGQQYSVRDRCGPRNEILAPRVSWHSADAQQ